MATPRITPCCEVTWKIQNFSCCRHEENEELHSSFFHIDSLPKTHWTLSLCPRGEEVNTVDCISLYLVRSQDIGVEYDILLTFELAVLDNDNHAFHTKTLESKSFTGVNEVYAGCSEYVECALLFQNRKTVLLRDELTIRCRIWKDGEISLATSFQFFTTNIEADKCHFLWKINYLNCLSDDFKETLQFKNIFNNKVKSITVKLSYFIHGKHECIKVVIDGEIKSVCTWKCNIRIAGTQELFFLCDTEFNKKDLPYTGLFKPFITRETILESKELNLENEFLILDCEMVFMHHNSRFQFSCKTSSEKTVGNDTIAEVADCQAATIWNSRTENEIGDTTNSIEGDLKDILRSGQSSDFTLKVQQKTFPVHSAILAARSPVFKKMLETDFKDILRRADSGDPDAILATRFPDFKKMLKEKSERITEIEDIDTDAVTMMLNFLYTNHPGELTVEKAMKLYYAGGKYEIKSLKVFCSMYLQRHFSIENICDLIELSDRHNNQELFQKAVEFINAFKKDIIHSEAFKKFKERNVECAMKVVSMLLELTF